MKVAFARKIDEEPWQEVLLTEHEDRIEAATAWAKANGYVVRVVDIDLSKAPEFGKNVIND